MFATSKFYYSKAAYLPNVAYRHFLCPYTYNKALIPCDSCNGYYKPSNMRLRQRVVGAVFLFACKSKMHI